MKGDHCHYPLNTFFVLGEVYQLQAEIARERRSRFGGIWERFSSEETLTALRGILTAQPAEEPERG